MRSDRLFLRIALGAIVTCCGPHPALGAWPHEPSSGNVALCTAANDQLAPSIISDGAGGAIVAWYDGRGVNNDIYVQRVSAAGSALWATNGLPLCTAIGSQLNPVSVPDGAGGAIVVWYDRRSGTNYDLYAQRVNAAGVPQWAPTDGVAVCTFAGDQLHPTVVADGSGGVIVAWEDLRNTGVTGNDVYAQRVSGSGALQWTSTGVLVSAAPADQLVPMLVSDGAGGAIFTWQDYRIGSAFEIYAQRVSAAGAAQWAANGVAVCAAANDQLAPTIVSDGVGGAIVTWYDLRSGQYNVYAQRVSATGAMQWPANGVVLSTASGSQLPAIATDGAGGAIVTWYEFGGGGTDIFAQRVSAAGVPQWATNGVAVCIAANDQYNPTITSDGAGGAIVSWLDYRTNLNFTDVYAQRLSATGIPLWAVNGVAVSTALQNQSYPVLVSDGAGGAIVTWPDNRNGLGNADIFAQRVERYGQLGNPEATIASVRDVPNDQGGQVKISWSASYLDVDPVYGIAEYRLFRSVPPSMIPSLAARNGTTIESDRAVREARLLELPFNGTVFYWEYVGNQAAEAFPGYSMVAATTSDSVTAGNPRTSFMVEARAGTSLSASRWFSAPDSGYSVDNLGPATPAPFTGQYAAAQTRLHWNPNAEADLAGYRLYRGDSSGFPTDGAHQIAAPSDTGYADVVGAPHYYKLTAVDIHGNESTAAVLLPQGTLDAPRIGPRLSLARPSPNPASSSTRITYALPRAEDVSLAVFDASGRRVRSLADGAREAGEHSIDFALRDDSGRALPAGRYFLRLEAEGRVLARAFAVTR